jgi:hypothetical protein
VIAQEQILSCQSWTRMEAETQEAQDIEEKREQGTDRERCRTTTLITRVQAVQSKDVFANQAQDAIISPLDIMQERGVRAVR